MEITVNEYIEADYYQLFHILHDIYDSEISKEKLEEQYLSDSDKIYVAKCNDKVVGCAFLQIKEDYIRRYRYGFVSYVAVDVDFRKKGIGKALFTKIFEVTKAMGGSAVELTSADFRIEAHGFYDAIGFSKKKTSIFIKEIPNGSIIKKP